MESLQLMALHSPIGHSLSKRTVCLPPAHLLSVVFRRRRGSDGGARWWGPRACAVEVSEGGKMVMELVGAFNELTERMNVLSTSSSRLLFKCLKLSIPILQASPLSPDGRSPLSKALSVAMLLADLQVS